MVAALAAVAVFQVHQMVDLEDLVEVGVPVLLQHRQEQEEQETLHQHHHHKEIMVDLDLLDRQFSVAVEAVVLVWQELPHLQEDKVEMEQHLIFQEHQ
jgi:hypothetical protein